MKDSKPIRPVRLAHIGIQSADVARIRDWYITLLGGEVVFERIPFFSFVTFDDEHHRFAIHALPGPGEPQQRAERAPGFSHTAFAMGSVFDLLTNYERARDAGIKPEVGMHHGTTLSLYYRDPDGNQVELSVDRFKNHADARRFMDGPVFQHSLGMGDIFQPEEKLSRMKAGANEDELMFYDEVRAMNVDPIAEMKKILEGPSAGDSSATVTNA